MPVNNKPHSSEPIAVIEQVNGSPVMRFTDAWYQYFDNIDRNINVSIVQNITNASYASSITSAGVVSTDIEELRTAVDALAQEPRHDYGWRFDELRDELLAIIDTKQPKTQAAEVEGEEETASPVVTHVEVTADYTLTVSMNRQFSEIPTGSSVAIIIPPDDQDDLTPADGEQYAHYIYPDDAGSTLRYAETDIAYRSTLGAAMPGSDLWYFGVEGADGKVYAVPNTADNFLVIDPATGTATNSAMGGGLPTTGDKWCGGALASNNKIYCAPRFEPDVLIIDPATNSFALNDFGLTLPGGDAWRGAVLGADGKVYCVPFNANDILIIDPATNTAVLDDMGASMVLASQWVGGVLASNNKIYCAPNDAEHVLIIDPTAGTATLNNFGLTLTDSAKWNGIVEGSDGKLYCIPYQATDILIIDPVAGTAVRSALGATLTGPTKWSGGSLGPDNKIYCAPRDATDILVIDPVGGTAARSAMGADLSGLDKWRGAVAASGKIYGIPHDSADILIISAPGVDPIDLLPNTIYTLRKSILGPDRWLITSDSVI